MKELEHFISRAKRVSAQVSTIQRMTPYPSPECSGCKFAVEILPFLDKLKKTLDTQDKVIAALRKRLIDIIEGEGWESMEHTPLGYPQCEEQLIKLGKEVDQFIREIGE